MKRHRVLTLGLAVFAFIFAQGASGQTAKGPLRPEGVALSDADAPQPVKVMIGEKGLPPFQIAPPADFAERPQSATFTIDYLNAGDVNYFGDVCVGWPPEAQAAFTYAANVWGALINSTVPITVVASWANLGTGGLLGHAGARDYYMNFAGAPQNNTYFPVAIANALTGTDLNGSDTEEITAGFNAQFPDWYFGTGTCPADKIDFVQVIMHEFCHGLGFIGSMDVESGLGYWGLSGTPTIYDRFTEDEPGSKLLASTSGTVALYNQLVSGNVYFNGPNANTGNGGARAKLYSPNPWKPGSSYAHLDEIYNGTANAMMTYSVNWGETIHDPGPVTMGILKDNGWNTAPPAPPEPTIKANGAKNTVVVNYPDTVSITVSLNAGSYAGVNVDWWLVAFAHAGQWVYINSAMQPVYFDGNLANCHPINQGPLFDLTSTTVLDNLPLSPGTYDFWFAVTYPMTGILDLSGTILYDKVTVVVQ